MPTSSPEKWQSKISSSQDGTTPAKGKEFFPDTASRWKFLDSLRQQVHRFPLCALHGFALLTQPRSAGVASPEMRLRSRLFARRLETASRSFRHCAKMTGQTFSDSRFLNQCIAEAESSAVRPKR